MAAQILYSTNTRMKLLIAEKYRKDVHYAWCGDCFDSSKVGAYSMQALTAPSSDPCAIYKQLSLDVQRSDKHSSKIKEQKLSLAKLAVDWKTKGEISTEDEEEIIYMMEHSDFSYWKPLLYVISRPSIDPARIKSVPIGSRASFGAEYIISDLQRGEFDIVELE
jgi:hypothetical protein